MIRTKTCAKFILSSWILLESCLSINTFEKLKKLWQRKAQQSLKLLSQNRLQNLQKRPQQAEGYLARAGQ